MSHLTVVLAPLAVADGRYRLSDKTVTGMMALAERWVGRVSFLSHAAPAGDDDNMGLGWYSSRDLGLDVVVGEPSQLIRELAPDVVQASLVRRDVDVLAAGRPTVLVAENPARERLRYAWPNLSVRARPRAALGSVRQGHRQRTMVVSADGLACNGWSAWNAYRAVAARAHDVAPVLFFDTRLSLSHVSAARERLARPARQGPLRLAFSGRLHPAKGPQFAVRASAELDRRGIQHSMVVLGDGPMRAELESYGAPSVTFAGQVAFEPEWVERMSNDVDVMVLPHTQGDPSGTYLESAGLGVPVAGFGNSALRGHERQGFAWASSRQSVSSLADLLEELDRDRTRVHEAGRRGVEFMTDYAFESEFDARVSQLAQVAELKRAQRHSTPS